MTNTEAAAPISFNSFKYRFKRIHTFIKEYAASNVNLQHLVIFYLVTLLTGNELVISTGTKIKAGLRRSRWEKRATRFLGSALRFFDEQQVERRAFPIPATFDAKRCIQELFPLLNSYESELYGTKVCDLAALIADEKRQMALIENREQRYEKAVRFST